MTPRGVAAALSPATAQRAVVVTRAESHDGPLCRELKRLGLPVLLWPAVQIHAADPALLREALTRIGQFDWIVFASRPAVAAVLEYLSAPPPHLRVAVIGTATAKVLRRRGWSLDVIPRDANAAGLVQAFEAWQRAQPDKAAQGARPRVLYPASSRALPTLAAGLTRLGAEVTQVEAYRTEGAPLDTAACREAIAAGRVAAVTFTSPSAVQELARALGAEDFSRLLRAARAVVIGPTTAQELARHGHGAVLAQSATLEGVARATHQLLNTGS
ncbi:MAG: uroporphyrinogen-III synthase [Proteobacteria bacterium]|nr:uroporphyrinogen-III synthase [Pseudomonadota bacterium]